MVDSELITVLTSFKYEILSEFSCLRDEFHSFRDDINARFDSLEKRVISLENTCTILEKEHGDKLDLLLDYVSANIEKHEKYDKNFELTKNTLFDHDVRLGIIESTPSYKKYVKTSKNLKSALI